MLYYSVSLGLRKAVTATKPRSGIRRIQQLRRLQVNKLFNNSIIVLVTLALALASGCATWSGPRGRGHSGPFEWNAESDTAMSACQDSRSRQRRELLCDAGILSGARCEGAEVTVSYRDSVRLICEQSNARESAGESRAISRDDCERLLATDGIPADATGTVRSDAPSTADPVVQRIIAMNPALWQDDHAFCVAITTGYGTPTAGGIGLGGAPLGIGGLGGGGMGVGSPLLASSVGHGAFGGGISPGTVSFYYPVRSYLPRNVYAQFQVALAANGAILGGGVVGNVAPGVAGLGIVTPTVSMPLTVPRGTMVTVTWACVDASGANASRSGSVTGPANMGVNLTRESCGLTH